MHIFRLIRIPIHYDMRLDNLTAPIVDIVPDVISKIENALKDVSIKKQNEHTQE